ncbi:adenine phosphoribosyltransferase isoform X1 [Syngnathus typhle]|uniref:adenine phosphoribosyltransferase isoform X1 n=1 Tax=Syngnathus typhle TaxID=161592 RepID=UPI002A6ACA66|nr:adenine phosphoribosyltransferase isoform X1 [Syngnathus typhle]
MDVWSPPPADGASEAKGWYLALMAPNSKGPAFAWLDPSRLYCNSQALADCVKDLLAPFRDDAIDLVAGIDAMGFILGASVASTLGKGFLAVRKAGHLCVSSQRQSYSDYTGREKSMEVRDDVIRPGVRVLLVDQWIETGGTMKAAIQLLERLGATVAWPPWPWRTRKEASGFESITNARTASLRNSRAKLMGNIWTPSKALRNERT